MSDLLFVQNLHVAVKQGHLLRRRSKTILHGVSLKVGEGESVAYLGPNGAGKTTTFRALLGLAAYAQGTFFWRGREIKPQKLHRHIGFMPESPYLYRNLTPSELLTELGRLSHLEMSTVQRRIHDLSVALDFTEVLTRPMRYCSKGQLQRVGLAQALLHDPELLILDEPMSGLDPLGRERVRLVLQERINAGCAMLFSSHILADAAALCHKVIALRAGKIVFSGPLAELEARAHSWRIRLRGALPNLPSEPTFDLHTEADGSTTLQGQGGEAGLRQALHWCLQHPDIEILEAGLARQRLEDAFVRLLKEGREDST